MAINPELISLIKPQDVPNADAKLSDEFFFFEGNKLKKTPISKIPWVQEVTNITNNNIYELDPEQIVPSEALYVDDTLAGDILKRIDIVSGTNVNYKKTDSVPDEVDGFFYIQKGDEYFRRTFDQNTINVAEIGYNSDAINRSIAFASADLGVWSRQKYKILLSGTFIINEPIVLRNLEGFSIIGEGLQTTLQVGNGLDLPNVFEMNGVAYSQFKNFSIVIPSGSTVENVFEIYWGDRINNTQDITIHPRRSTTQNTFENIRMLNGKYKSFCFMDGHNQNDVSRWVDITVHGDRVDETDGEWWENGFLIGDGSTGNNLLHRFENIYLVGLKNAYFHKAVGGIITSGGASKIRTFVRREGVNETLLVEGVRLESVAQIYSTDGYLNGINDAPDNVTFQNLYFSGAFEPNDYFKPSDVLPIIFHAGGTFNLIGSTINNFEEGVFPKIKLSGAQNSTFHNNFNIIGSNVQMNFQEDVFADAWSNCQLTIIGSNESTGFLGTQMGRPYDYFSKKFGNFDLTAVENLFPTSNSKRVGIVDSKGKGIDIFTEKIDESINYSHIASRGAGYNALYIEGFNIISANLLASVFQPLKNSDAEAANNTIYFSTSQNKLVYKDEQGVANNLY